MSTYNPDKLPTPYDYGLDPEKWDNPSVRLRFVSLTGLELTVSRYTEEYAVRYPIHIGYDVPEWSNVLSILEKVVKNELPLKDTIVDDNIQVAIDIYNPYHDMAHPDTLWIELRNVQTNGIRGQEDFRFKIARSKFLEELFVSLDNVLSKNNNKELMDEVSFDNERYQQLKTVFKAS